MPHEDNFADFQAFYEENFEYGWVYPDYPNSEELFNNNGIFSIKQTPEETDRCISKI